MEEVNTHFQDYHFNVIMDEGKKNITLKTVRDITYYIIS